MYLAPEMSNQIDIMRLLNSISEATPECNAQLMAGLAMHVRIFFNYFL